jgi:4-amino-4-deoxy-L-arabinose transferase-like glycosyltransferase
MSLLLGLCFVFVLPPHPWGWRGIDQYHELARALARGEPFGTTDVPWGYAYYVAGFYRLFGEVLWAPLVGQVLLNALVPLLLYHLVRRLSDHRTGVLSAVLVGILSFNTVYASTQSSDSVCTVGFLAMLLCFLKGAESGRIHWFAASGLLAGIVAQFRPNLILFPFVMAGVYLLLPAAFARVASVPAAGLPGQPLLKRVAHASIHLALVVAALAPWTIRNYRLTGEFLPSSTHGSVQLWYGTLPGKPRAQPAIGVRGAGVRLHEPRGPAAADLGDAA